MSFGGMNLIVVDPGTEVGEGPDGEKLKVEDDAAVTNGRTMWITPAMYEAIKASSNPEAPQ